jgi:hypothetical protein
MRRNDAAKEFGAARIIWTRTAHCSSAAVNTASG